LAIGYDQWFWIKGGLAMSGKQEREPTDPRLMRELAIARDPMDLIKIAADASR
jgi:hypothetical protein